MATLITAISNAPVKHVDLKKYSGKWYVIGFIPTSFDKNWEHTTESYTLTDDGNYAIYTTYTKNGKPKSVNSKGFIDKTAGNAAWKVQFVWPFRADYWIIEHDENYTYTVVGHPKKKFLYIMSRTPHMSESTYKAIVARCKEKGYAVDELRKQEQE